MKELLNFIFELFFKSQAKSISMEQPINKKEYINLEAYLMGRDKTCANELNPTIITNAQQLLQQVNAFLNELNYLDEYKVSSGWRPLSINSKTPNAAKASGHMIGKAVDIHDDINQTMGKKILEKPQLLHKYGLWLEDLGSTKGWCHLDNSVRSERPIRVFKP